MPGPNRNRGAVGDVHPDYLQPLAKNFNVRVPLPMYAAIQARALATGTDTSRVIRDLIRAGAAQMDPPMNVTSC
jgi:Ribbon-helix-helix protein, copG family